MADQTEQEPELAHQASSLTKEGQEVTLEAKSRRPQMAEEGAAPNNITEQSPPTSVDKNGKTTSTKNSTDSSLADLKREVLSSRQQQQPRSISPHRGSSGPTSPFRVNRPSSSNSNNNNNNNNNPSLAASTDYALAAHERAVQLQYRRKIGASDRQEESPWRPAAADHLIFVGEESNSHRSTVPANMPDASATDDAISQLVPSSSSASPITRQEGRTDTGGLAAFVAEPGGVVKADIAYVEASMVIRTDEVDAAAAHKRRRTLLAYLMLFSLALLTTIVVPMVLTRKRTMEMTPAPSTIPSGSPTMAPTALVIAQLLTDLQPYVHSVDDLRTKGTPQSSAMLWIALEDEYSLVNNWSVQDERFIQRFVLAVICFALHGDWWDDCPRSDPFCVSDGSTQRWLTNTNECSWKMLSCDDNGQIAAFANGFSSMEQESDSNVFGVLPPEISRLTALQEIRIKKLQSMDIYGKTVKTVKWPLLDYISNMTSLRILEVKDGDLLGTIPSYFASRHPLLTRVDLRRNALRGTLPEGIGSLQSLEALHLADNALTGEIPLTLYNLTGLVMLDLGNNRLRGTIADEIGKLTNLVEVVLGPSLMTGPLPPALFTLPALATLSLQDSQYSGSLREEDFAQIAESISVLRLENNDFSGPIPIGAWEMATALGRLQVFGNPNLIGTVTQKLCDKRGTHGPALQELKVGCNIRCSPGCCDDNLCDSVWPMSKSELPP